MHDGDDMRQHRTRSFAAHLPHWTRRGLPRLQHEFSRGNSIDDGRGCFPCVYVCSSMLQVSRSTQKLLVLPQVSAQTDQVVLHYQHQPGLFPLLFLSFPFVFRFTHVPHNPLIVELTKHIVDRLNRWLLHCPSLLRTILNDLFGHLLEARRPWLLNNSSSQN